MAPTFSTPTKYLSFSILFLALLICHANGQSLQQTGLVFFLHDVATGPNATVVPVTGMAGKVWSYNTFGTIFVVDDLVTLTPNWNSTPVGRAQGLLTVSASDGTNVNVVLSIVFTNLEYSGSSLQIQGTNRQRENYREVSVVSGTGKFRFARGFAALETVYYELATTYSVIRLTVTLFQA